MSLFLQLAVLCMLLWQLLLLIKFQKRLKLFPCRTPLITCTGITMLRECLMGELHNHRFVA